MIAKLLARPTRGERAPAAAPPKGPPGKRCYAIGDVHGRLDLLTELMATIAVDSAGRPAKSVSVVMMGDLIDRGPDSRGVVSFLKDAPPDFAALYNLMGNHEEMMVRGLTGEPHLLPSWLEHGGYACAQSYGVEIGRLFGQEPAVIEDILLASVPQDHIAFLKGFLETVRFGDYLFAHAGIRPGVPVESQASRDLRWIRDEFLNSTDAHGVMVVHGHTIAAEVDERRNRIGIDTGAYETGVLTAIRIEDEERGYLQARGVAGER